jgi:hypothetical protein
MNLPYEPRHVLRVEQDYMGIGQRAGPPEEFPARRMRRRKPAHEQHPLSLAARHGKRRGQDRRARNCHDGNARPVRSSNQVGTRVEDGGRAGIRDKGDVLSLCELLQEHGRFFPAVAGKTGGYGSGDAIARQKPVRDLRVLGGNDADSSQDTPRPQGEITRMPDRYTNHKEPTGAG